MENSKIAIYWRFLIYKIRKYFSKVSEDYYIFKHYIDKGTYLFGGNHITGSKIGKYSYVAYNSILQNCEIGRYCSIGPNVVIGFGDHKINSLSTHPSIYLNKKEHELELQKRTEETFSKVIIKNDVWIGANVYVRNGVTIGNGAIIGSGAIVINDVADYAIVGGVPAKFIRSRFDQSVIDKLLESKWWEDDIDDIKINIKDFENGAKI